MRVLPCLLEQLFGPVGRKPDGQSAQIPRLRDEREGISDGLDVSAEGHDGRMDGLKSVVGN